MGYMKEVSGNRCAPAKTETGVVRSSLAPSLAGGRVPTFREAYQRGVQIVNVQDYEGEPVKLEMASAAARVIADVLCRPDSQLIEIGGEQIAAVNVKQVYELLDARCVRNVIERMKMGDVMSLRAYLRTALFNSAIAGPMDAVDLLNL